MTPATTAYRMNTGWRRSAGRLRRDAAVDRVDAAGACLGPGALDNRGAVVRLAEQVPLAKLAAELTEGRELPDLLDPLGDDLKAQRPAERDDCPGECPILGPAGRRPDEFTRDLQDVDLEAPEVPEGRVPRPEVIDRDADPQSAKGLQPIDRRMGVVEHRRLGEL